MTLQEIQKEYSVDTPEEAFQLVWEKWQSDKRLLLEAKAKLEDKDFIAALQQIVKMYDNGSLFDEYTNDGDGMVDVWSSDELGKTIEVVKLFLPKQ